MRWILVVAASFALVASGCSSGAAELEVGTGVGGVATAETPATVPGTAPAATVPGTAPAATVPGTAPAATAPTESLVLERNAVLLTHDDVGGDWDSPSTSESDGWDIGPNQTDCDVYWDLESLATHPVSHRMWFQPGANLNHDVHDTGAEAAESLMDAAERLADECPKLSWGEGGTTWISGLPVGVDGVVAFELFDEAGETSWHAYAGRENLVSRLWRVHFEPGTQPTGRAFAEFERLAATMVDRLGRAETVPALAPATTSTPTSTSTTSTSTTTAPDPDDYDDHPLTGLLLSEPELPAGLAVDETLPSVPTDPEDQLLDGCDASQAVVTLDGWFELQRSIVGDGGLEVLQIVGRAPSADEATAAVSEFGRIGDCTPPTDSDFEDTTFSGGPLDGIEGATAAWLEMQSGLFAVRFVAYQSGDVVGAVILSETESDQMASFELHRQLLRAAVDLAG